MNNVHLFVYANDTRTNNTSNLIEKC